MPEHVLPAGFWLGDVTRRAQEDKRSKIAREMFKYNRVLARMTPIREGWRVLWRTPALVLCELTWRWTFGVAFWSVAMVSIRAVLINTEISEAEYQLLRISAPFSLAITVAHLLQELGPAIGRLLPVPLPALAIGWVSCATAGRFATLKVLLPSTRTNWRSLLVINLVRQVVAAAALLAFLGAALMIARHLRPNPKQVWPEVLAMLMIGAVITFFWSLLNGFLSLAPIWAVRDCRSVFAAVKDSVSLLNDRPGPYIATWSWIESLRFVVITVALFAAIVSAGTLKTAAPTVLAAGLALVILLYLAVMDFIQIWRIAAYVALANASDAAPVVETPPFPA